MIARRWSMGRSKYPNNFSIYLKQIQKRNEITIKYNRGRRRWLEKCWKTLYWSNSTSRSVCHEAKDTEAIRACNSVREHLDSPHQETVSSACTQRNGHVTAIPSSSSSEILPSRHFEDGNFQKPFTFSRFDSSTRIDTIVDC